eukprot:TRINITY_DN40298_c0_g1_i1.p1 TRINITY_DN40298_c0_g1~~TRINITY_DN40298_c0_g1_i1.p1  ORF type:complete len:116 (-),score=33.47 TRINITY_DN40298_c0_g1_i1:72-419(-)
MGTRVAAQIIVSIGQIISKAVVEGYKGALANAQTGLRAAGPRIKISEAEKILGVRVADSLKDIEAKYLRMMDNNSEEKGGSFYLQSKMFRAYEVFEQEHGQSGPVDDSEDPKPQD